MMDRSCPADTKTVIRLEKLFRIREKRLESDFMAFRMVKCAAALEEGEHVGWQMIVPTRGMVRIDLFGSGSVGAGDLEWAAEKAGRTGRASVPAETGAGPGELYELCLPAAEVKNAPPSIGFGCEAAPRGEAVFAAWPGGYSCLFDELVRVLRNTGAVMRLTAGPASPEEQETCRRNTLRTLDVRGVTPREYTGRPVKVRALLRLPGSPSVRLRSVAEEAIRGGKLRRVGGLDDPAAAGLWEHPLRGAAVLPEFAARVLMLEPALFDPAPGVELCEEETSAIPASHGEPRAAVAVKIGRAEDASGARRKIAIGEPDLKRHYQIIGQTGTGKSTLLTTAILSAVEQGLGLTFFDPHGSTVDTVLRSLPAKYADRVRVVRIGDADDPVPLNIWDSDDPLKEERNISDLCELFTDIFDPRREGVVGPRYERWLSTFAKASIALLGRRASLESVAVLSQSRDNMVKVCKALADTYPDLANAIREEYVLDKSSEFHMMLGWLLCKFQRLTSVRQLRETLGAGANALDFEHTIDSDTVTLIDLASPVIGTHAARIVGTLVMMKLWNAAMTRTDRDRTHLVVVDEASLFQTNPMPRMLAESRKFGLAMVLCHQHSGQLTAEIREALEANSANFSAFRLSPRDAAVAAVRFDDPDMKTHLTRLDAFNAITTLSVDGRQTAPFTLEIGRPRRQKDGETIAAEIETRSVRTLVEPYRDLRALTPREIQYFLDSPDPHHDLEEGRWWENNVPRAV